MKNRFRIISVLLLIVMAFSFAACSSADTSYAMTAYGEQLPAGIYVGYIIDGYMNASTQVEDTEKDLFEQQIDEKDVEQWILDEARESSVRHIAIDNKFKELGLEFNEINEQSAVQIQQSILSDVGDFFERNGCSDSSLLEIARNTVKADILFEYYYGDDGEEEIPEDDIEEYFLENYIEARLLSMSYTTIVGEEMTDEEREEIDDMAEDYFKRLEEGEEFLDIFNEYQKHVYESQGLYNYVEDLEDEEQLYGWYFKGDEYFSEDVADAIFGSELDEPFVAKDDDYIVIGIRNDNFRDEEHYEDVKDNLRYELKGDEFTEDYMDKWIEDTEYQDNEDAISRYSPRNVK